MCQIEIRTRFCCHGEITIIHDGVIKWKYCAICAGNSLVTDTFKFNCCLEIFGVFFKCTKNNQLTLVQIMTWRPNRRLAIIWTNAAYNMHFPASVCVNQSKFIWEFSLVRREWGSSLTSFLMSEFGVGISDLMVRQKRDGIPPPMNAGPWFNIKMSSYQYRKSHYGDKTILRPSYLHNGISYTGKTASLYWIRALECYIFHTRHVRPAFILCMIYMMDKLQQNFLCV